MFSLVVCLSTVRVLVVLIQNQNNYIKIVFFHGDLSKEIYMQHPKGFKEKGKESLVCRLKKAFYGLKYISRYWYKWSDSFMMSIGFIICKVDHCTNFQIYDDDIFIILLLYVNDMLVVGPRMGKISPLKTHLTRKFDMKD